MSVPTRDDGKKVIYDDALRSLTWKGGLDCAWFAERVEDDAIVVKHRFGAVSEASGATVLHPGQGLGGLILASQRIQSVDDYMSSSEITHDFDKQIAAESLTRVIGAPVMAGGTFYGVLMGAARDGATFGGLAAARIERVARRLSDALFSAVLRERIATLDAETQRLHVQLREIEARSHTSIGSLRRRERDVLKLVALGRTNREVAAALHLTESTVKSYLRNVMVRLGLRNRVEAIAYARGAGIL